MASPRITSTPYDRISQSNSAFRQWIERGQILHERSFANFWDGPVDDVIANAEALNQFCADHTTAERPISAATIFQDHGAIATLVAEVRPELPLSTPPVTMDASMFTAAGAIDTGALRNALEAL